LTTKRGDSGSAGMLEENSVITEAPKTDTIIDQKSSQTRKSDKNLQKSTKLKNIKINKIKKVTKSEKVKNAKTQKVRNQKSEKCQKIVKKVTPPQNGQNVT